MQTHLEEVLENDEPKLMPKGYAKTVERLRKQQEEHEKLKRDEELKNLGQ